VVCTIDCRNLMCHRWGINVVGVYRRRFSWEPSRAQGETVIYRLAEVLLAPKVAFGSENGGVTQQELNLLNFSAAGVT